MSKTLTLLAMAAIAIGLMKSLNYWDKAVYTQESMQYFLVTV